MLEFQAALGLHEGDDGPFALHLHLLYSKNGDGPPLVYHHFEVLHLQHLFGRGGYGDGAICGAEVYHALHAFLWPYLRVLLARVAADDSPLLAANLQSRVLPSADFWAQEQWFIHIVAAGFQHDFDTVGAARVVRSAPLAGLSEGVLNAFAIVDDNDARVMIDVC